MYRPKSTSAVVKLSVFTSEVPFIIMVYVHSKKETVLDKALQKPTLRHGFNYK